MISKAFDFNDLMDIISHCMKHLDLTFPTPQENLAADEILMDLCEEGYDHEILRLWEPAEYFVVLGYSNKARSEVHLDFCRKNRIPILRRASGGGTVLQGPGCLNYSLVLQIQKEARLKNITETNRYVLAKNSEALRPLLGSDVLFQGQSDLTLRNLKFSGNAQRRRRRVLLFHGTFLLNFDLSMIAKTLPLPSRRPDYRADRTHENFLTNLEIPAGKMEPPGQARGTLKTRLRPFRQRDGLVLWRAGSGEVRPTQKHRRRHLAEAGDTFIPRRGGGLLRRRIKERLCKIWNADENFPEAELPRERIADLAGNKYCQDAWNYKF